MSELIGSGVEFLSRRSVPVWMFLVALLTSPAYWSNAVRKRATPLVDRYLPVGGE